MRGKLAFVVGAVLSASAWADPVPAAAVPAAAVQGSQDLRNLAPLTAPVPTALASGLSTLAGLAVYGIHRRMTHRRV